MRHAPKAAPHATTKMLLVPVGVLAPMLGVLTLVVALIGTFASVAQALDSNGGTSASSIAATAGASGLGGSSLQRFRGPAVPNTCAGPGECPIKIHRPQDLSHGWPNTCQAESACSQAATQAKAKSRHAAGQLSTWRPLSGADRCRRRSIPGPGVPQFRRSRKPFWGCTRRPHP